MAEARKFTQLRKDDCLRAAVGTIINVHPRRMRFIEPNTANDFWGLHAEVAREHGWRFYPIIPPGNRQGYRVEAPKGLWIAIVPSHNIRNATHAIVMEGRRLFHDPSRRYKRTRTPRKITAAWKLSPID
jgi:hypothetical protein